MTGQLLPVFPLGLSACLAFGNVNPVALISMHDGTFLSAGSRMIPQARYARMQNTPARSGLQLSIASACWPCFQGDFA
ncbi:hypothetical protein METHP14_40167 [Pseudomonas sp. P14-2025]